MKKIYIIVPIIIVVSILSILLFSKSAKPASPPPEKYLEIIGLVTNVNDKTLIFKENKGLIYNFDLSQFSLKEPISAGDYVTIEYKGTLDSLQNIQQIEIKKISKFTSSSKYPKAWDDDGIFSKYYSNAYEKLNQMTLDEKIGQLFLVRVPEINQIEALTNYHLGGYILFGRDTVNETKESLLNKIESYQAASQIPLLIATDEEGGTVVRISSNKNLRSTRFNSPQTIYNEGGLPAIKDNIKEMNNLLSTLKINVNLAPVVDVSQDENDFIYQRSLGQDAKTTAKYTATVIETSKNSNVSYVLKHFPGYGNNKDTHTGISIDNRSLESLKENDLLPFAKGINSGAEAIMVSHNIITNIDAQNPASLSVSVHNLARDYLKFTGILITDDLDMAAISQYTTGSAVVNAILAGNDMLIISDYEKATKDIKEALNNGQINEELLNQIVFRILSWKYYKGLIK